MSSTRDFKSPGIFAEDASTVIPPTPIAGVAYRDAVSGTVDTPNGWRYGTRVESQDWNQIMFLLTSMAEMQDKQGILGYSDQVDYVIPALVFGSDGLPYLCIQANGPSTAVHDPVGSPLFWEQFSGHGQIVFTIAGVSSWTVPMAMQIGYVKPMVTVTGGGGGGGRFSTGGGGGGGGGVASSVVDLSGVASVSVTVGAGGGGRVGSSGDASPGGSSSFGSLVVASGGGGASTWAAGAGGIGITGSYKTSLGPGSAVVYHNNPTTAAKYGGGSGGGPGARGADEAAQGAVGFSATLPGGGGGGGNENGNGGNGAPGSVVIEW
jgi:hypothetical protein